MMHRNPFTNLIVTFAFERLQAKFEFHHGDYEKQFLHAVGRKDKAGMVMNNPNQSVFLFVDRQHLQVGSIKHEIWWPMDNI